MRTKKVNRYYCDFCGRGGCAAGHMAKHEKRCTKNPNRECGVCLVSDEYTGEARQKPMPELVAVMPDITIEVAQTDEGRALIDSGFEALNELTEGCPCCILAALRQSGWSGWVEFDFKGELKSHMEFLYSEQRGGY